MTSKKTLWESDVAIMQEDEALISLVIEYGAANWALIAQKLQESFGIKRRCGSRRTGKQCRDRYTHYLAPETKNDQLSASEVETVIQYYTHSGTQWKKLTKKLPGRSTNAIKNAFYSTVRRNLRKYNRDRPPEEQVHNDIHELLNDPYFRDILLKVDTPGICRKPDYNHLPVRSSPRVPKQRKHRRVQNELLSGELNPLDGPAERSLHGEETMGQEHNAGQCELLLDALLPGVQWSFSEEEVLPQDRHTLDE